MNVGSCLPSLPRKYTHSPRQGTICNIPRW